MYLFISLREMSREPHFVIQTGERQVILQRPFIGHECLHVLAGCFGLDFGAPLRESVSGKILLRAPTTTLGPGLTGLHFANDFRRAVGHNVQIRHTSNGNIDFSIEGSILALKNTREPTQANATHIHDRHTTFGEISLQQPRNSRKQDIFRISFNNDYAPSEEQIGLCHIKETGQKAIVGLTEFRISRRKGKPLPTLQKQQII